MPKNVKKRVKVKWKNVFKFLLFIFAITVLVVMFIKFISLKVDYSHTKDMIKMSRDKVKITSIVDDEYTTIIEQLENLSKFDSYWNYIKLSMIEADLASLKKINSHSIGWIEIKGTDISYPVVQYSDNEFYKTHSFDKKENRFGWIYLDANCNLDESNNTIIYGNKNSIKSLFGNLNVLFSKEWQDNDNNFIIKFSNGNYTSIWQIFSIYKSKDNEHLNTTLSLNEYYNFIKNLSNKSLFDFKVSVKESDKILTLTTNDQKENYVVHAKLIKIKNEPEN